MLFPLGFDAKLIHEKSGKKKETMDMVSFMFHLDNQKDTIKFRKQNEI